MTRKRILLYLTSFRNLTSWIIQQRFSKISSNSYSNKCSCSRNRTKKNSINLKLYSSKNSLIIIWKINKGVRIKMLLWISIRLWWRNRALRRYFFSNNYSNNRFWALLVRRWGWVVGIVCSYSKIIIIMEKIIRIIIILLLIASWVNCWKFLLDILARIRNI